MQRWNHCCVYVWSRGGHGSGVDSGGILRIFFGPGAKILFPAAAGVTWSLNLLQFEEIRCSGECWRHEIHFVISLPPVQANLQLHNPVLKRLTSMSKFEVHLRAYKQSTVATIQLGNNVAFLKLLWRNQHSPTYSKIQTPCWVFLRPYNANQLRRTLYQREWLPCSAEEKCWSWPGYQPEQKKASIVRAVRKGFSPNKDRFSHSTC